MLNRPAAQSDAPMQLLRDPDWQMSFGERAALEGVLSQLRPQLAIEIGTAEGGSLARIAAHSAEVHSFDLVEPAAAARSLENVTFHTGDSHALLPQLLERLAEQERNVDFVLVDGDHSTEGVRQDMEDLLASPAIGRTVILMHDTMNEVVRAGLEQVRYASYPKVAHADLDFVAGYMFREPSLRNELWGGLGLVVVDARRTAYFKGNVRQERYYATYELVCEARDHRLGRGSDAARDQRIAELEHTLELHRGWLHDVQSSPSWRLTAPLRAAKRLLRGSPGD